MESRGDTKRGTPKSVTVTVTTESRPLRTAIFVVNVQGKVELIAVLNDVSNFGRLGFEGLASHHKGKDL